MADSSTSGPTQDRTNPDQSTTDSRSTTGIVPISRRNSRAAREATTSSRPAGSPARTTSTGPIATQAKKKRRGGWILNAGAITVAAGIIATMAIPAFAFNPNGTDSAAFGPSAVDSMKKAQSQTVEVGGVATEAVSRDTASATSEQQLNAQKAAAAAAAAAEAARAQAAIELTNYAKASTGPSVSDFLANPPYPSFSLAQVFSVAQQYIGTPYVYGGASPAGMDCSGYVMYVYAQFGINLPHSVSGQAAMGKRISIADAQPGDVVIMSGHDGFYAGNGNIMDAPDSGRSISIRPIWTSDFYIVRLGI
ncbi:MULTISPECIES: C40 family peptidase [unclassified Leifsonia]|uniref:C40 family peptidase n=1 Tax=unclassified Leifsonia TaxID=2663824 RepID=UPI0008A7DB59|nr:MULTISPECIES: C40 family peptidase [unclassified Leifsonia]SEI09929.1 Cell wall-associated hydrolase, NlpC family [Leifsonia sp. CL154]SFL87198.1 Cell wall-associated hydrolase, NlpC family [Leifsonia sp. CL147]